MTIKVAEMDQRVSFLSQLDSATGPVTLINTFHVGEAQVSALLAAWADDASWMREQPGYIRTQLHRGVAGSTTFVNVAVWESAAALRAAFVSPEFQAHVARYPGGTTSPHLFEKVAVSGICVA